VGFETQTAWSRESRFIPVFFISTQWVDRPGRLTRQIGTASKCWRKEIRVTDASSDVHRGTKETISAGGLMKEGDLNPSGLTGMPAYEEGSP